jgi:hypothetical protein
MHQGLLCPDAGDHVAKRLGHLAVIRLVYGSRTVHQIFHLRNPVVVRAAQTVTLQMVRRCSSKQSRVAAPSSNLRSIQRNMRAGVDPPRVLTGYMVFHHLSQMMKSNRAFCQ